MELDQQSGEETFQRFREYAAGVCNDSNIEDKRSVREIFRAIRDGKCWDLNGDPYHLLLQVMEGVEDPELMASVEEAHENYYTQYLVATKVVDHMFEHEADKPEDYRPDFTKLSIKLDKINVNDSSVAYLIDLWEAVKRCLQLPDLFCAVRNSEWFSHRDLAGPRVRNSCTHEVASILSRPVQQIFHPEDDHQWSLLL